MARPPAKAQRLADALAAQIVSGDLPEGSWLPSERELGNLYSVDRSTVRRALQMLENRGLVTHHPASGTQVQHADRTRRDTTDITRRVGTWRGFHVSATEGGREPYTETKVRDVELDASTARWLGVPTGTTVLKRARLQGVAGDPPIQLSTTWILPEVTQRLPILRQVDTGPGGMLTRMEEAGYQLRFEDVVSCRLASPEEQATLHIEADHPVLEVWRRCYDQTDRVVEVTQRVIAAGRHELIYRYDAGT